MLSPALAPFTVAIGLMLLIALMEAIGALVGVMPSSLVDSLLPEFDLDTDVDLDADADFDADTMAGPAGADAPSMPDSPSAGPLSQVLSWLCVGKVPVLVLLIAFLVAFGLTGIVLQSAIQSVSGLYLPAIVVVIPATIVAIPAMRYLGVALSKIIPKEHSEAISRNSFIGKIAVITQGVARANLPAQAKFTDFHGQSHYLLVIPDNDTHVFNQGTEVLIVSKKGSHYCVIENTVSVLSKEH